MKGKPAVESGTAGSGSRVAIGPAVRAAMTAVRLADGSHLATAAQQRMIQASAVSFLERDQGMIQVMAHGSLMLFVMRLMIDETAEKLLAKIAIKPGVENKSMPDPVHAVDHGQARLAEGNHRGPLQEASQGIPGLLPASGGMLPQSVFEHRFIVEILDHDLVQVDWICTHHCGGLSVDSVHKRLDFCVSKPGFCRTIRMVNKSLVVSLL